MDMAVTEIRIALDTQNIWGDTDAATMDGYDVGESYDAYEGQVRAAVVAEYPDATVTIAWMDHYWSGYGQGDQIEAFGAGRDPYDCQADINCIAGIIGDVWADWTWPVSKA